MWHWHGDGRQGQAISRQIELLKIARNRIIFLGQRFDVPQLLCRCDLYVCPSYRESFGLALLEAMAVGLPVIATDTSPLRSLIDHNRTGLLVPAGPPHPLAQAIIALTSDAHRRSALSARARQFACQKRFSIPSMVTAFEGLFELLT